MIFPGGSPLSQAERVSSENSIHGQGNVGPPKKDSITRQGLHHSTVNELLRLTLLEPAVIQSILAGQQPRCMSLLWIQRNPLPTEWASKREVIAAFDR